MLSWVCLDLCGEVGLRFCTHQGPYLFALDAVFCESSGPAGTTCGWHTTTDTTSETSKKHALTLNDSLCHSPQSSRQAQLHKLVHSTLHFTHQSPKFRDALLVSIDAAAVTQFGDDSAAHIAARSLQRLAAVAAVPRAWRW